MLETHVAEFRVADLHRRLAIIKTCLQWIQERWDQDAQFNRKIVETVCAFTITLGLSEIFLACSPVPV
jgi:hypothetical protein